MNPRRVLFIVPAAIAMAVALWPTEAAAQRRVVRRAPSRVFVSVGVRYGYPIYRSPFFYDPFWWGFYDYQFPRYPYPPYGYGYYDASADLRIQVTPRQAEVYIDGYLTGTVDDYDGVFQRLRVPLGEHEVTIYAQGYRSIRYRMLFRPFESYTIKEAMQPLGAGDPAEARPAPSETMRPQGPPPRGRGPERRPGEPGRDRDIDQNADRFGAIAVRVQPSDAEVLIDGERWEASTGDRILVQLSEGSHRVEIRKSGYRSYTSTVRIRTGETVTLNVSLSPE